MALFLGIDGGQSSTTAVIGNEHGHELGRGVGGPCNHVTGPEAISRFTAAIGQAISQACRAANRDPLSIEFEAACLGLSGGAEDKAAYVPGVVRAKYFKITDDAEIAWAGATARQPGVIVIAGTGSIAWGKNSQGRSARAGGWGYIFGDEGSAFDLSRKMLRAALRSEEGWGPPTALQEILLTATGHSSVNSLMHDWYRMERSHIASFAPLVAKAAECSRDKVALSILLQAGSDLAQYAEGVWQQLFSIADRCVISFAGRAFLSPHIEHAFASEVRTRLKLDIQRPAMDSAAGALQEAIAVRQLA